MFLQQLNTELAKEQINREPIQFINICICNMKTALLSESGYHAPVDLFEYSPDGMNH